jgi:multiple sugar transport system permease protein
MKNHFANSALQSILYILLVLLGILCFLPFYIMIINSTHSMNELMTRLYITPGKSFGVNFAKVNQMIDILRGFMNSAIITVSATVLSGYVGALTAFGIAKYQFPCRKIIYSIIIGSMMIPAQLGIVGFFRLNAALGTLDSYFPLIVPAMANASTVFFIIQYMEQALPDSLLEAARIEGCGEFVIFNRIVIAMVKPAIATMSIFNFIYSWNNFMTPMIVLFSQKNFTLPLLIMNLRGTYNRDFGATYCGIALSVIPILIAYAFMSRHITSGLTAGAVKG